jgi:hypothetical protein
MRKKLVIVFLAVMFLSQGCAAIGEKKIVSASMTQGCEVFCESNKTLEDCEKESREFFGLNCRAVHNPEWAKERFSIKDSGNPTATEMMKSRIISPPPIQRIWIIKKK